MSDGFRYSEKDSHVDSRSPWIKGDHDESDKDSAVNRAGWGDNVSPLVLNMKPVDNTPGGPDPNANGTNGQKPWRAGWAQVAPAASHLPQADTTSGQDPNQVNSPSPWRAGFGGSNGVAPDAQRLQPVDATSANSTQNAPSPWRSSYPDSSYKGPDTVQPGNPNLSPWQANSQAGSTQSLRAGYPESTFRGPDVPAQANNTVPDWATYARQQQAKQEAQSQSQPFSPSTDAAAPANPGDTGNPGNPGLNNVSADQRQYIENSLNLKTSMVGYLGTGALTGGTIGAGEWYLDNKLLSTLGQEHSGLLGWWETHSPVLKDQQALTSRLSEYQTAHATRSAELALAGDTLDNSAAALNSLLGSLNARISDSSTGSVRQLLQKQQSFIADAELRTNPAAIAKVIGTKEEVEAGAKLFASDSLEAKTMLDLSNASKVKSAAEMSAQNAAKELDRTQTLLSQSVEEGAGTLKGRVFDGAAKGLAVAGGTLAAGYALDKLGASVFGYKQPQTDGMGRFLLDGVAVPAVLLSDLPSRYKFALAGSAFVSARAADYFAGTGASIQMSTLLRPNTCDGVLMTAAAMAPVEAKTKAMLVAGAWGVGRVYNEVAHLTGLDGGAPAQLRDDALNTFTHDQLTRSESSFDNAVAKGKTLGKENEAALELQMRDWLGKQASTNPATHMRGTAIIADALGQFRLEEGNRFDLTAHADQKARVLKGFNYDFGGEATTWLRLSAGSLVSAQNYVLGHKGQTIDGQSMDDAYVQQLKNEQSKVEAKLNLVYGAHDMQGVFDELVKQARVESGDMQQALVRMKNQLEVVNSQDNRFLAKSCRDITVGYLAEAAYMAKNNNGEEARIMCQAAAQYLQKSEALDSNAPDNQALEKIQSTVAQGIPGAISNQYKSNLDNPFQIKTPNYGSNLLGK